MPPPFCPENVGGWRQMLEGVHFTACASRLLCRLHTSCDCTHACVGLADVEMKLTPLSSTKFAAGRPSEQAHAVGNFIKTSIVE